MSDSSDLKQRLIVLETVVAHVQHQIDQLNEVLIQHSSALQRLKQKFDEFETHVVFDTDESPQFDPESERPPHY